MNKILIFVGGLGGGGAERVFVNIGNELHKRKYDVEFVVTGKKINENYKLNDQIKVDYISSKKKNKILKIINKFFLIRKKIKENKKAIIISFFSDISAYCTLASIGVNNCNIVCERNNPYVNPKKKVLRFVRKIAFFLADKCVFQTQDALNYFGKNIKKKSVVIKNPIVVEILPEVKKFEERENVVLGIGRIVPQKNFLLLIKAWQKVCDDFPEYVLHIYGEKTYKNGMFAAEIEKYILQNKLEKKVYLKGFSNSIYNVLNNSKLYISSSDYEGMSNVIIEALAMGVPTIATDCPIGGSREIIKNGVNGFLVPVNDIEMMSNMIRRVLNNTKLQKDISSEAIKIKKELSIDIICDEWENILKETF